MQKTLMAATVAAILGMGGAASAADLNAGGSMKDAPVYAAAASWTGFYLGVGGGGGATSSDLKASLDFNHGDPFAEASGLGGMGGFGTVQIGYDRQIMPRIVVGAFFDYDFDAINSSFKVGGYSGSLSFPFNLTDQWTVGGRAGYLVNPDTLVYLLAGYTEAHFDLPSGTHNSDFSGATVGAGLETSLGGNWFLKGEYRFSSLDRQTIFTECFGESTLKVTDQPDIQTGRLVLSYKLSPGFEPLK